MARLTDWQRNIVGPFWLRGRFKGQVSSDPDAPSIGEGLGRVFRAVGRDNGRRAVVLVPRVAPRAEWALRLEAGVTPTPFIALEVERAPIVENPVSALADDLDAATCILEDLEDRPDALEHLRSPPLRRRRTWQTRRIAGSVLAAVILAVCTVAGVAWWPPATGPADESVPQLQLASAAESAAEHADPKAFTAPGEYVKRPNMAGNDLPRKPRRGQARADKHGKCETKFEVAIYGLCWVRLHGDAPCGPTAYEYEGGCYRPSMEEPTSKAPSPRPGPLGSAQ